MSPEPPEETEPAAAMAPEAGVDDADEAEDYDAALHDDTGADDAAPVTRPMSQARLATIVGSVVVIAVAALAGWLGVQGYQSHHAQAKRQLFVQVARQAAVNLTTVDWQHAEDDVQRLLDQATGTFYDNFAGRKQPFIDVVKKTQSKSVGTVSEAGLESESGDEGQVLVAVSIRTSNLTGTDQPPRQWRMKISVRKSGNEGKVSNVTFVPSS
jgi:Mce-associated membrane protein